MYMTTLAAFAAMITIFTVIVARPEVRPGHGRPNDSCQISQCQPVQAGPSAQTESLPRLSRNRWERRDIARMLMTDDDYTGQILPQPRRPAPDDVV